MRYRLRTLLLTLAIAPPILGWLHSWVVPPPPPPHLIVLGMQIRNYSGGREHPNWLRDSYRFEEHPDSQRATLIELPTGNQWERDQAGRWHQLPRKPANVKINGYVLRGTRPLISGGWLFSAHEVSTTHQ